MRQAGLDTRVLSGEAGVRRVAALGQADVVMAAIVGAAGLLPALDAVLVNTGGNHLNNKGFAIGEVLRAIWFPASSGHRWRWALGPSAVIRNGPLSWWSAAESTPCRSRASAG